MLLEDHHIRYSDSKWARNVAIALLAVAAVSVATPASGLKARLGAQISAAGNSLTGVLPNEGDWIGRFGAGANLIVEFNLAKDVAISFQPGFAPRNSRQQFEERGLVTGYNEYELDYVSLPVLIRVSGKPRGVRGFVTAGMDLSVLINAKVTSETGSNDIDDILNSTTLGALFGAGAFVPVGRNFITLELRYVQGLDDIVARDGSEAESALTSPSVKYRGLELMVGFLFALGGE